MVVVGRCVVVMVGVLMEFHHRDSGKSMVKNGERDAAFHEFPWPWQADFLPGTHTVTDAYWLSMKSACIYQMSVVVHVTSLF